MRSRRTLRNEILHSLAQAPIISVFQFLENAGCYDYSYGKVVFRQLEKEGRILMTTRSDLHGHPLEVRQGPRFYIPARSPVQLPLGDL